MNNIYEKLAAIQSELKAPKNQYNSFGKYHYRSCEDIREAIKPILSKYKCVVTISDTVEEIGGRIYIEAEATFTDGTSSVTVTAHAREEESKKGMDSAQLTGATSSYARKYALNGLFLIDDNKDADTDAYAKQSTPKPYKHICDKCGSLVVDAGGATAEQIATATKKKYGKCICKKCLDSMKAVQQIESLPVTEVHE